MNYQEKEIKFYLQDLPAMANRLRVCGADLIRERIFERNLRMDMADHRLQKAGRLLRLRKDDKAYVTYKDHAQIDGGVITRTEIEFVADDFEVARKLFEALGYQVVVIYEKYRRVFKLGDVVVALDELPFGDFVEIEASTDMMIEGMAQMLRLNWQKGIPTNYLGLFEIAKTKAKLNFNDLTFENFENLELLPADLDVEPADG